MNIFLRNFQVFFVIFFITCLVFCAIRVQAIENTDKDGIPDAGIQISPTKFIWTLEDGEQKTSTVNVKNYSDIAQKIIISVEDFYVGEDGSEPLFFVPDDKHPRKNRDVINWITLPENFVLAPGESKNIDFVVSVPSGQPTNGYYGSIFFEASDLEKNDSIPKSNTMGINYRIGSLVIMSIQGDEPMKIDGELQKFYTTQKVFWTTPAKMKVETINTGNIHYPLFGKIEINKFGKKFHVIELKPQLVYPDIVKNYEEDMEFGIWDFGRYNAHLSMWSQDKTVKFEQDVSFWVIPWKGLLIIIGSVVGLIIIGILFKKYVHIGAKPIRRD